MHPTWDCRFQKAQSHTVTMHLQNIIVKKDREGRVGVFFGRRGVVWGGVWLVLFLESSFVLSFK